MIHHLHTPSVPALLRMPEVIRRTGLRRSSIYDAMKRGDFPKPVPLTSTARAWHSEEIDAWIAARLAARTNGTDAPKSGCGDQHVPVR